MKPVRDVSNRHHILCHIIPRSAVPTCCCADEVTFFVKQGDGNAVHFGFDREMDPAILRELLNPRHKFPHLVWRVCVVETLHRHDMASGNECLQCLAADGLRWRVLFSESREGLL